MQEDSEYNLPRESYTPWRPDQAIARNALCPAKGVEQEPQRAKGDDREGDPEAKARRSGMRLQAPWSSHGPAAEPIPTNASHRALPI